MREDELKRMHEKYSKDLQNMVTEFEKWDQMWTKLERLELEGSTDVNIWW